MSYASAVNASLGVICPKMHEVFVHHPGLRAAFVFGSVARGTDGPESDVDLAISGTGVDLPRLATELSLTLGREVDVVSLDRDPSIALLQEILREGICVFEAEPGAGTSLRTRLLWAVETDGPALESLARRYVARLAARSTT